MLPSHSSSLVGARGSAIVLVLALITLAGLLLTQFIERAMTEMLVESRARQADRLRIDAHSALEASLAVLAEYQAVDGGLHAAGQGWGEPLDRLDLGNRPETAVTVVMEDESARSSLPRLKANELRLLGVKLGLKPAEAATFAEALLAWTSREHASAKFETDPRNYEYEDPPHRVPGRPLASFEELRSVAVAREWFFTPEGEPTARLQELKRLVSLHDFPAVNVNAAGTEALELSGLDAKLAEMVADHRAEADSDRRDAPEYFRTLAEAQSRLGLVLPAGSFDTQARCLRVRVAVREGATTFRLNVVVSPVAGAEETAPAPTGRKKAGPADLQYPFKLLAFEETIELAAEPTL